MMRGSTIERLAWELETEQGHSALFAARYGSSEDLEELVPLLRRRGLTAVTLDEEASQALMLDVAQGRDVFPVADAIVLTDALALLPAPSRAGVNLSREVWLSTKRCFLFAERTAGSPEMLRELRDFVAVFRDVVDLRPDVGCDDHFWDTGAAGALEMLARRLPATTRGSTVIAGGRVHYKQRPLPRCPSCEGALQPAIVPVRFTLAPVETAVQRVAGYRCACGSEWPDPFVVRAAHSAAFRGGNRA